MEEDGDNVEFNEKKATQSAALFISLAGKRRLNYLVLIKYLYLADRKALTAWGRSVTNDLFYSMKLGPVLSRVLDLIDEPPIPDEDNYWHSFISPPSEYCVTLTKDPGTDRLSIAEEKLIKEIFQEYRNYQDDPFGFSELLHSSLPEWEKPKCGRKSITIRSILSAAQKPDKEIDEIEDDLTRVSLVHSMFGVED